MAIDPSIVAQGVKPVEIDPLSLYGKYQAIQSSATQNQLNQAKLPGEQAESQMTQQKAAGLAYIRAAAMNPANRNQAGELDSELLAKDVEKAGFPTEAQAIRKDRAAVRSAGALAEQEEIKAKVQARGPAYNAAWQKAAPQFIKVVDGKPVLDSEGLAIHLMQEFPEEGAAQMKVVLDNKAAEITNSTNAQEKAAKTVAYARNIAGLTGTGLMNMRDPANRQGFLDTQARQLETIDKDAARRIFGEPNKDGHYQVKSPDYYLANALTPEESQNLVASKAGVTATMAGATATMAGVEKTRQEVNAFNAGTLSPAERADLLVRKTQVTMDVNRIEKAITALDKIGGSNLASKPFSKAMAALGADPARAALENVKATLQARGIDIDKVTLSDPSVRAILATELENQRAASQEYERLGTNPTKKSPTEGQKPESKSEPKPTVIRMKAPDGTIFTVKTPEAAAKYEARGATRVKD